MNLSFLLVPISTRDRPGPPPDEREAVARALYDFRRHRADSFPADLLGEPGWDIMLLLYLADFDDGSWPVTSVCAGAGVPATTAHRWIATLEKRELIERMHDRQDKRRMYLRISERGRAIMDKLIDRMR